MTRPQPDQETTIRKLQIENALLRRAVNRLARFKALAYLDPLTELGNKRYADARLAEELSRARRLRPHRFAVLMVDIDRFKAINDRHGHGAGDEAIRWLGGLLRDTVRAHDVCCRIGGDEFLVILPGVGRRECAALERRLAARLALANQQRRIPVDISVGAGSFPDDGETPEAVLEAADAAMYRDKRGADAA